jgi:D-alanyl-D-alanine carboxypeptidase
MVLLAAGCLAALGVRADQEPAQPAAPAASVHCELAIVSPVSGFAECVKPRGAPVPAPPSRPQPTSEATQLPDTRAATLLGEWLALCRPPLSEEALRTWYETNLSAAVAEHKSARARARDAAALCTTHGGLELRQVTVSEPAALTILTQGAQSGLWLGVSLASDDSGRITKIAHAPEAPPEEVLPQDLSGGLTREVRRILATLSQRELFSGIVTVARGGKPLAVVSVGYADRKQRTPITAQTRFNLASLGKIFTAVCIGQLIDRGTVSLDDRVGRFFPDYPNQTVREQVTVGMLLSHMAGLGDFLGRRTPAQVQNGAHRADEFMPLYDEDEPQFPPGTAVSYSNAGLALAGAIVEKVSGEPYPQYLRRHVFAAAGMSDSDPNNIPRRLPRLAKPYTRSASGTRQEAARELGNPAEGAISTAADLVRFAAALREGRLIRPATLALLESPHPGSPTYGYGFGVGETYGETWVGHGGALPGVSTSLTMVLQSPYTIVVLSNQDPPSAQYAAAPIIALLAERAKRDAAGTSQD